jgi:hypothetical protein
VDLELLPRDHASQAGRRGARDLGLLGGRAEDGDDEVGGVDEIRQPAEQRTRTPTPSDAVGEAAERLRRGSQSEWDERNVRRPGSDQVVAGIVLALDPRAGLRAPRDLPTAVAGQRSAGAVGLGKVAGRRDRSDQSCPEVEDRRPVDLQGRPNLFEQPRGENDEGAAPREAVEDSREAAPLLPSAFQLAGPDRPAPEVCPDPGHELGEADGLRKVVVRAALQPTDAGRLVIGRRHQDDRQGSVAGVRADLAEGPQAVQQGHVEVEQREIDLVPFQTFQRSATVRGDDDPDPLSRQALREQGAHHAVVVRDEHDGATRLTSAVLHGN